MSIKDRIQTQVLKLSVILIVILVCDLKSCSVMAQGFKNFARDYQLGFEGAFGVKNFTISSNIAQINGLNVTEEGGTVGVTLGAKALRVKLRQGYFYSSSTVAQTIDEVRSAFVTNLYPLQLVTKKNMRLQPYFMGGIERNIFKMYGTYGAENSKPVNYSLSEAPYLGKISNMVASVGAGLEYGMKTPGHFVNFFAEARYGKSLRTLSASSLFKQTSTSDQLMISVGVGFGYYR